MQMTINQRNYIKPEYTNIIKGIALIFMFVLHFFCWPEWYVDGIEYPTLVLFAYIFRQPFDICVCIFAFLTGYCYAFTKNKSIKYSIRKCSDIWITYAVVFCILVFPAIVTDCFRPTLFSFIQELFAWKLTVMYFCWYVLFYIMAMIALPLYIRITHNNMLLLVLLGIVTPWLIARGYARFDPLGIESISNLIQNFTPFSVVASGYIFAEFNLFERCFDLLFKRYIRCDLIRVLLYFIAAFAAFMGRKIFPYLDLGLAISMDIVYAPIFIYAVVNIVQGLPIKILWNLLSIIGKYSLEMWFFSSAFFNCCKSWSQKILYFPGNPVIVLAWGGGNLPWSFNYGEGFYQKGPRF